MTIEPRPWMQRFSQRWLLLCGVSSGVLHAAVYLAQQRIHSGPDASGRSFIAMLALYGLATSGLFALYGLVLYGCRRQWIRTTWDRRFAIGIPIAFNIALVPTLPSLSIDVYSYLAHGYVSAALDANPYVVGARAVALTPFGRELAAYGWQPVHGISPYGPLLTHLERSVVATGADVHVQILLFKIITGLATLASAGLIWVLLGRLRPDDQLLGTTAFLWNPLVIWELSGEGHNDAVMILFILGALLLFVQGRQLAGIIVVCLAILTKYLPAILVPLCAAYCYRTSRATRRLLLRTTIGLAIGATVSVVLFRPFWIGMDTFNGVRVNGAPGSTGSTPTMILEVLERFAPHVRWEGTIWGGVTVALVISIVVLAATVTSAAGLLRATAVLWLLYTLLMSPTYWPWYAAMVVAAMALTPDHFFLVMGLVVSFAARLVAPLVMVFVHGVITRPVFFGSVWILGLGLPLLVLSLYAWQPFRLWLFRRAASIAQRSSASRQ